jgi:hypothetical protein
MKISKSETTTLIKITAYFLSFFVAVRILQGATGSISIFTSGLLHILLMFILILPFLSLVVLFFINLVFIPYSPQKIAHLVMLLLILITFEIILPLSHKWEHHAHRQWFFKTALPKYQVAVEKIMRDKTILTNEYRLHDLVGRPAGCQWVGGETNADGSVIIFFPGGDDWREGYLYYSGAQIVARPYPNEVSLKDKSPLELIIRPNYSNQYSIAGHDGYYYYHLTNGWYEH